MIPPWHYLLYIKLKDDTNFLHDIFQFVSRKYVRVYECQAASTAKFRRTALANKYMPSLQGHIERTRTRTGPTPGPRVCMGSLLYLIRYATDSSASKDTLGHREDGFHSIVIGVNLPSYVTLTRRPEESRL